MDAKDFFRERARMLNAYGRTGDLCIGVSCADCPLLVYGITKCNTEESVDIVEKWSKEHPRRTYLDVLLEAFPNTPLISGVPDICPNKIGLTAPDEDISEYCDYDDCTGCWNREYKEDK